MKIKLLLLAVVGSLFLASSVALAAVGTGPGSGKQALELQSATIQQQAANVLEETQPKKPSKNGITILPYFEYSHNSSMTTNLSDGMGGKLKLGSGDASGATLVVVATREINKYLALSFFYQYTHLDYDGGGLSPNSIPGMSVKDKTRLDSNAIALFVDIDTHGYGRLHFHALQAFDEYRGSSKAYINGTKVGTTNMDNYSDRLTSFIGWYEYDIPLAEQWVLTPYVGWRAMYAHIENLQGDANPGQTDNSWVHLVSGGLKLNYNAGLWGAHLRGGINHRVTEDDVPGFSVRSTSPKQAHSNFHATLDQTVGSWGVGGYAVFPGYGVLILGYDGYAGSNTHVHTVTLGFSIPF